MSLIGFMVPVHRGTKHTQFLLSERRFLCEDCHDIPPPSSLVEVNLRIAESESERPNAVCGRLKLVHAVLRLDHPLAANLQLSWKQAAAFPWILPSKQSPLMRCLMSDFDKVHRTRQYPL